MSNLFQDDNRLPQTRLAVISYIIVGLIALLLVGFWKLQIVHSDQYAQMAERNRIRTIPVIAPRGPMLDREGRVLVDNYPSFSVLLLRDDAEQLAQLLPQVADGLGLTVEDVQQQIDAAKFLPHFQPIVIKPEASPADIAFIESHRADVPVLEMLMVHRRRYPRGGFMAHVSGYVGEVSAEQIQNTNGRYRPGDIVGKSGLENQYNERLMGTDGMRRVIVNSVGREVGRLDQTDAIPGKPISLTIDYDLQLIAEQRLAGKRGAVVAIDPRTGEMLAMASQPSYDPNDFAVRISKDEWRRSMKIPRSRCSTARFRRNSPLDRFSKFSWPRRCSNQKLCRQRSKCFAPDMRSSMGAPFTMRRKPATAKWICTTRSCTPATFISTMSASSWASTASLITPPSWDWAARPVSTCLEKIPASFLPRNGSSASFTRNGTRAKRFPSRLARARPWLRRFNLHTPSEESRWAARFISRTC